MQHKQKKNEMLLKNKEVKIGIAKFMRNNNYKLVDNEGGGDCLFAVIRDGLKRVGIHTSVAELRDKLANEATQDIFEGYRNMYLMAKGELNDADRFERSCKAT